jgi:hypothetical protein
MQTVYDHNRIRVIDGFLDPETCAQFRDNFELCARHHQRRGGDWVNLVELELWNLTHRTAANPLEQARRSMTYDWTPATDLLTDKIYSQAESYVATWGQFEGVHLLPHQFSMEGMRIKCYRPNGLDQFKLHVDVADRASSGRFLSFLLYLNDSDAGTEFPLEGKTVEAREGRLLMFPPLWTYPHIGHMPKDGSTKYILSTYLHYI